MTNTLARIGDKLHVFRVLHYRGFRLYWFGHLIAVAGHQMVILAQGWLAWELTRSEYVLGALGLVAAAPAVALTLFGGAAADKLELRRFLMLLQHVTALLLFAIATLVVTGWVRVWHVFAVAFIHGGIQAFDHPARQALFPHLLDRSHLMNAVSLNSMIWPGTRIFGPALAGYIISYVAWYTGAPLSGAGAAYYVAAATYFAFGLLLLPVRVPVVERTGGGSFIHTLLGGLSFVWTRKLFRSLIGLNYLDIFFLASHTALLPVFADVVFRGGGTTLGNLYVARLAGYRGRGNPLLLPDAVRVLRHLPAGIVPAADVRRRPFPLHDKHPDLGADPCARRLPRPGHGHLGHELQRRTSTGATADGRRRRIVPGPPYAVPGRTGRRALLRDPQQCRHAGRGGIHRGYQPPGTGAHAGGAGGGMRRGGRMVIAFTG